MLFDIIPKEDRYCSETLFRFRYESCFQDVPLSMLGSFFQRVSASSLDKSVSRDIVSCRAVIRASRGDGFAIRRQYFDTWKTAPFLPHEKAKMPHECPRFYVMSAGSHNRHSLFWVKGLQPNFELNLPGATFHLTSTNYEL